MYVLNEKNLKVLSGIHSHSSFSCFFFWGGWVGLVFFSAQLVFGLIGVYFYYLQKRVSVRGGSRGQVCWPYLLGDWPHLKTCP